MNLVIALTHSPHPRSFSWIRQHVEGYGVPAEESTAKRQFDRDRAALAEHAGIILTEHSVDSGFGAAKEAVKGWALDPTSAFMPRVEFSAIEKELLATASQWAHGQEQQNAAQTAFRKLASAGVAAAHSQSVVSNVPDHIDLDEKSLQALFRALDRGLRIEFDYYPAPLVEPTRRQLEPWAYATLGGRMYVTGYAPDRNAQRTFRLARLGDIHALPQFIDHPAPTGQSNHELVRRGLSRAGDLIDATVEFRGPGAWELRAASDSPHGAGTTATIRGVHRQWLIRTAAAYATDAVITSPASVVEEVKRILLQAAREEQQSTTERDGDPLATAATHGESSELVVPDSSTRIPRTTTEPRYYGEQFSRCVDLLAWFANHPGGSFMSAARDLGTTVPQIKYELKQLQFCGLPGYLPGSLIEIEFRKTGATVQFSAGITSPIRLTPSEATAVRVSLEAIRDVVAPENLSAIDSLANTIVGLSQDGVSSSDADASLTPATITNLGHEETGTGEQEGVENKEGAIHSHLGVQLAEAIRRRQTVSVEYTSLSSDSRTRRVLLPDHLAVVDGETYLWARETDDDKPGQRKYATSRIVVLEVGEPNTAGPRVEPLIDSENPFGWSEQARWATVAVAETARWMLEYQQMWVIDDDIEANDGDILVTMPDTGDWIERFIIAYTPSVRCSQPLELAARVRHRARRGLSNYLD